MAWCDLHLGFGACRLHLGTQFQSKPPIEGKQIFWKGVPKRKQGLLGIDQNQASAMVNQTAPGRGSLGMPGWGKCKGNGTSNRQIIRFIKIWGSHAFPSAPSSPHLAVRRLPPPAPAAARSHVCLRATRAARGNLRFSLHAAVSLCRLERQRMAGIRTWHRAFGTTWLGGVVVLGFRQCMC